MIIIFTQECEAKMKELERHLQIGLQRFLDLKKVLDSFQEEIEYSDDSINGFIQVSEKTFYDIFCKNHAVQELQNSHFSIFSEHYS